MSNVEAMVKKKKTNVYSISIPVEDFKYTSTAALNQILEGPFVFKN